MADVGYGMDIGSATALTDLGVKPQYAQVWAGPWNEKAGWDSIRVQVDSLADRGITPVVEWFYWGNDISQQCVTNGCWSNVHQVHKSAAQWSTDSWALASALHQGLAGRPAVVVVESEFNKQGVQIWEAFDGYLAGHMNAFRTNAPEVKLALGFGNWGPGDWWRFDRAVAAVDYTGLQTMRASTRDSRDAYLGAPAALEYGASRLHKLFGKPIVVHDVALATYGGFEDEQETALKDLFGRVGRLDGMGVKGIVYRALRDNPGANGAEYYGAAEATFGLIRSDGSWKPAMDDWVNSVKSLRSGAAGSTNAQAASGSIVMEPQKAHLANWVQTIVKQGSTAKVEAKVNGGPWYALSYLGSSTWGKSLSAPEGSIVQFRAWDGGGAAQYSPLYRWGDDVRFAPKAQTNPWWIETYVNGDTITKVETRINGGPWQNLPRQNWGAWAASLHTGAGGKVEFRAWTDDAAAVQSGVYTWGA